MISVWDKLLEPLNDVLLRFNAKNVGTSIGLPLLLLTRLKLIAHA